MKNTALFHQLLSDNNIKYIFGNPGTTETPIMNALEKEKGVEYILGLQENTVIGIAAGYAMASQKMAMVNVHTYPGLANSMCNLYTAFRSKIPMLITAGQQNRRHLSIDPILSGPLTALASTATKYVTEIKQENDFQFDIQKAINIAQKVPYGPTFVSIPMDVLNAEIDNYRLLSSIQEKGENEVSIEKIDTLVESNGLRFHNSILIVDGVATDANQEIIRFAENLHSDIYTSPFPVKIPIPTTHYLYKGAFPSAVSQQYKIFEKYDTIIIVGDTIDHFLFDDYNMIPEGKTIIQINNCNDKVGEYFSIDFSFIGDIQKTFLKFNKSLDKHNLILKEKHAIQQKKHDELYSIYQTDVLKRKKKKFELERIVLEVLDQIDDENAIILEASSYEGKLKDLLKRKLPDTIYTAPRGGGLGWGMPVSVGISLHKKKHSICFVGDGGFHYSVQAIYTAHKYNIPVIFIILNNGAYKVLKELWKYQFPSSNEENYHELDLKPQIDLLQISQGYGAEVFDPKDDQDFKEMFERALNINGPSVLNIKL